MKETFADNVKESFSMAKKTNDAPSDRARLRRANHKAHYDQATIAAILDAQPLAYLGVVMDGAPMVFPTMHWREGAHVYIHGSRAGRKMKAAAGAPCCLTVSILDAFKLARSAFHHSVNFRSVMIHATPHVVPEEEKEARLLGMIEAYFPGRTELLRPMTETELKITTVLSFSLDNASAKIGTGGVGDEEEDYALPIWAGVVPVETRAGEIIPDPRNLPGARMPENVLPAFLRARLDAA